MRGIRVRGLSKSLIFRETSAHSVYDFWHLLFRGRSPGKTFWALRDLEFDVAPGELLGVVGPNGSGKTTLLRILARIYDPTEGTVEVGGRVVPLLQIGAGFHMDLTGRDNVYANASILGMNRTRVDQLFDSILAFSGIESYINVPVKYYSSGMFVRLAFAIAVHSDPEVVLTDEILAVGDIGFQAQCLERFNRLRAEGVCGLFVSHVPALVLQFCEKAIFLEHGKIQARGEARDVVDRYISTSMEKKSVGDGAVRIEGIELSSPDGPERIQWGLSASCEVRLECLEEIPEASLDLGLFSMVWGHPITWSTSQARYPAITLAKGKHRFRLAIEDLRVWPGTYYLQIRVRSGSTEIIPWTARRPVVVMPGEENSDLLLHAQQGAYYPRHRWEYLAGG